MVSPRSARHARVGGKIFVSWGPSFEGEAEIIAWDPGKRFAWRQELAVIEITLEARGAKTFDGWGFLLLGLQWVFEHHPGVKRQVAWPRLKVHSSRSQVYARLLQPGGIFEQSASAMKPGAGYKLRTSPGEQYSGRVEFLGELRAFCLSVRELNDALLWLTIEGTAEELEVQLWLSAFGLPQKDLQSFEKKWSARLKEIFS